MKRLIVLLLALIVVAVGLSFAMLNSEPITLDFYLGALSLPVSLWLVLALAVGVLLGLSSALGILTRQRWQLKRLRREAASSREEVSELRKLPLRTHN